MANLVFLNCDFVEENKALLHYRDLSFQRGYGVFDFFRLIGNKPLFLEDHLDRFFYSANEMHLAVPFERIQLKSVISELIRKNNLPDTGIRLSLTGGYSDDGFTIGKPNLLLSQHSLTHPSEEQRRFGIKLITAAYQRQLPQVKTIDYLMAIWLQPRRISGHADDILYQQNGIISECPRSNFFIVTIDGKIVTSADRALKGVTRKKILEIASKHYPVEEREITMDELKSAREAFITSTTKQVLPVRQIDEVKFDRTEVSHHLQQLFTEYSNAQ